MLQFKFKISLQFSVWITLLFAKKYLISIIIVRETFPESDAILVCPSERKNTKRNARTLRERRAPKVSKMAILILLFSTIYSATADIPLISDNYPIQEDSCRYNLAVVRFSYVSLNIKKYFKALDVPAACK